MNIKLSEKVVSADISHDQICFYNEDDLILVDMYFNDEDIFNKISNAVRSVLPVNVPLSAEKISRWENEHVI